MRLPRLTEVFLLRETDKEKPRLGEQQNPRPKGDPNRNRTPRKDAGTGIDQFKKEFPEAYEDLVKGEIGNLTHGADDDPMLGPGWDPEFDDEESADPEARKIIDSGSVEMSPGGRPIYRGSGDSAELIWDPKTKKWNETYEDPGFDDEVGDLE